MLHPVPFWLAIIAGCLTLISGITGKVPLWIPVLYICIAVIVMTGGA